MTDEELTAIVQAVKTVLTERDTSQRTEVEMLRQDLATLNARLQAHREASAESQQRMVHLLAAAVGDAVTPTLRQLQTRTAALEQRATEAAQ